MPSENRFKKYTKEILGTILVALSVGGGWYMVDEDAVGEIELVRVGWWNIRDLSLSSRDAGELELIAESIDIEDGPHVLAIGELNDPAALEQIAEILGPQWRSIATEEKVGDTPQRAEYYGFLWNSDIVDPIDRVMVDEDPDNDFWREPA